VSSQSSYARLAGVMYLLVLAFDVAASLLIGSSHRWGLVLLLLGSMSTVLLAVGLYVTVKPVDGNLALAALLFRVAEAAIGGMGVAGAQSGNLSSGEATAIPALFFCTGSTLFFYLFLRSTYIPRLLAGWGVFASLVYAAYWLFSLVVPNYPMAVAVAASLPILIAEVGTGLWLLIRGIKTA
jgi:uncharacterized protein DUF4386